MGAEIKTRHDAACCGCGWTGTMDRAGDHITGCAGYAQRWLADHDDECLDPGTEWARLQREDGEIEPAAADPREQAARHRAEQIRKAGVFFVDNYAAAVLEEDWKALGYDSVAEWREGEFGAFRLLPEVRAEAAQLMLEGGQPVPAIAAATEVDERTVRRDLTSDILPGASPVVADRDDSQVSEPPEVQVTPAHVTNVTPPVKAAAARKRAQRERQAERCTCPSCGHGHTRKGES